MIIKKLGSVITSRIFYLILGIFLAAGFVAYATWDEARTGGSGQLTEANWNALVTMVEEEIGAPSGAVMAFNLAACPTGWTELVSARGKTIVGLNPGDASFDTRGETGGEKTHTLTINEMPAHSHTTTVTKGAYHTGSPNFVGKVGHGNLNANIADSFVSTSAGGSQPHNNLQPYISFIYCQKN